MIKRSLYFTSVILMTVVFAMFVMLESVGSNASENETQITTSKFNSASVFDGDITDPSALTDYGYTALLCADNSEYYSAAALWCRYRKKEYFRMKSLGDLPAAAPEYLIIDPAAVNYESDIAMLNSLHQNGTVLIFANLPDYSVVADNEGLRRLTGIKKANSVEFAIDGIKLFDGFMLGGEYIFSGLDSAVPYYTLMPGNKVYMVGQLDEQGSLKNEQLPPVIWRYSDGGTPVFAISGDYCKNETALGVYTGIAAESGNYEVYPIVNAQNMITLNFPNASKENSAALKKEYSMDAWQLSRDYLWQNVVTIYNASNDSMSLAVSPQLSAGEDSIDYSVFPWYSNQLKRHNGELIYSASIKDASDSASALRLLSKRISDLSSVYGGMNALYSAGLDDETLSVLLSDDGLSSVSALVGTPDELLKYYNDNTVYMGFTYNAYENSDETHLRMISLFSALGYSSVSADMERLYYPENDGDTWSVLGDEWSKYHVTWWKPFRCFDALNVTQTESRVRRFLAADYSSAREDNRITVNINNFEDETFFILKLHGEEPYMADGAECRETEDGVWLIHATQPNIVITVTQKDGAEK